MTQARWELIKSAFLDASARPEGERQLFLEELAHRDQELVLEVCDLLTEPSDQGIDLRQPCWRVAPGPAGRLLEYGSWLANRFEITSCLGAGGAGEVYRAFDHDQREFVALKVLRPEAVPDRAVQIMLRHELHTARLVTHTNVCRLHEFYPADADALPFITMELVVGQTIQERLSQQGPFSIEAAWPVVAQMLDGLEAAHLKNVIHRDFKAGNIMLSSGGRVVLMDFGLARDLCPGPDLETTITANRFAGTLAYMSPEQLQGQAATIASDIHALGVVLFEILTGVRPFDAANALGTASRRLNEDAPRPRIGGRFLDRNWEYAIQMCLARDPQKRPDCVNAVRQILTRGAPLLWRRRRFLFGSSIAVAACWGGASWQTDPLPQKPAAERSALDHYLRGSKLLEEFSYSSAREAVIEFEAALAVDSRFALAMSAAADTHLFLKNVDTTEAEHHLGAARRFAHQAVQTDPSLAEAHNSLAAVRQAEWRWQDAELSYREALRLKPGLAKAHRWFCGLTLQFGRTEEALVHARRAIELDPFDRALPATIGLYYFLAGKNQEALELLEPAVRELDSVGKSGSARFNLAQVYARIGCLESGDDSRAYFTKALDQAAIMKSLEAARKPASPSLAGQLFALIHSLRGEPEKAEPFFAPMRVEYRRGNIPALHMAWVYAAQRKIDEAIAILDRGVTVHDPTLLYIKVVPFLENLRHDQRFQAIVQRMML